jgi:hypothetical protein
MTLRYALLSTLMIPGCLPGRCLPAVAGNLPRPRHSPGRDKWREYGHHTGRGDDAYHILPERISRYDGGHHAGHQKKSSAGIGYTGRH